MPRLLNSQTVQGVGATGVCVNNALIVPNAGSPAWVSSTQIVGNGPNGNAVISLPPSGPAVNLWEPGASVVVAGAGTIAAGLPTYTRLFNLATGPIPIMLPGVMPFDMDRVTGAMLGRPYQLGMDLWIWQTSNATQAPDLVIPTNSVSGARSIGGYICWTQLDDGVWRPHGSLNGSPLAIQARPGNVYNALLLMTPQGLWLLYTDQQGFIWGHPANDPSQGHTISQEGWGLDAEVQPDGSLLVAYCSNAGESAGSLQLASWSLTDLEPLNPAPIPPEPPNPEPIPIPPVPNPEPVLVSTGGVIAMADIKATIQHFGTFPYNGLTALRAEPSPSTVCWSVQPDGSLETRPTPGGSYEMFVLDGQIGSVKPDTNSPMYSFVLANVSGL